jgi:hypothetical protein
LDGRVIAGDIDGAALRYELEAVEPSRCQTVLEAPWVDLPSLVGY